MFKAKIRKKQEKHMETHKNKEKQRETNQTQQKLIKH